MVVQAKYYSDAIYCIDEPEAHMHTKLQGRVLRELYLLVPGQSQLWISTHSIGMLQEAEEIEKEHPGTVVFWTLAEEILTQTKLFVLPKLGKRSWISFTNLLSETLQS